MSTDDLGDLDGVRFRGSGERRRRQTTLLDNTAMRKRKLKSRKAAKVARASRKKQR